MKALIILLCLGTPLCAGEAIEIGASQCSTATAFNNARKIVRTLDDRRIVLFQTRIDNKDAVMLCYSDDGNHWATPFIFDYGVSPGIAISEKDSVYILWSALADSSLSLACFAAQNLPDTKRAVQEKIIIAQSNALNYGNLFASMDVDESFVQIAFQWQYSDSTYDVFYYPLRRTMKRIKDLQGPLPLAISSTMSPTPVIATDLDYQSGFVNIVCARSKVNESGLVHQGIPLGQFIGAHGFDAEAFAEYISATNPPRTLPSTTGCSNPSISVRNDMAGSQTLVGAWNKNQGQMQTCNAWFIYDGSAPGDFIYNQKSYAVDGQGFPSVDDIYFPAVSCAIVWQDAGVINYGQTDGCRITTKPFVGVSTAGEDRFPSVCYKTFRPDSFDVVWTQGAQPPYKIMYRRMQKLYDPDIFMPIDLRPLSLPDGVEQQPYRADLQAHGSYYGTSCVVIRGQLPTGLDALVDNDGELFINGVPNQVGDFSFTLQAGPRLPYFIPTFSDTQSYDLTIRKATLVERKSDAAPGCPRITSIQPNPFNATASIDFSMPDAGHAAVSIFDLSGRKVADILDGELPAGEHHLQWNAGGYPSGAYLLRLQVDNYSVTKKCLLLK